MRKLTSVTKPTTSKSSRRKRKKFAPKIKQVWQVKQPTVNWLDLPSDVMTNILSRIGVFDILANVQKVCTTWHQMCKEPAMWRAVSMDYSHRSVCHKICKHVVDRSQGHMVDISIIDFCDHGLLRYIVDRSSRLRRLEITYSYDALNGVWGECLEKLSLLQELSLCGTQFSPKDIEAAGRFCPLLKTLKVNDRPNRYYNDDDFEFRPGRNTLAVAIGKNLPGLRHLELIDDTMTNVGLIAILDGCLHLESLDLRRCLCLDLKGDLGERCSQQIKHLKLPRHAFYTESSEDSDSDDYYDQYPHDDSIYIDPDNLLDFDDFSL